MSDSNADGLTLAPCLIGLDWGTTSLRAMLIDAAGQIILQQAKPWGITQLPQGGFSAAFEALTAEWRAAWPAIPCMASGMVGSRQGWVEVPYCSTPAGLDELAAALTVSPGGLLHIVPGIALSGERPDFIRGEETQIIGLPSTHGTRSCVVLPGTHSKWVDVEDGHILDFRTFMTGEVFAALRNNTILGAFPAPDQPDEAAFERGVAASYAATTGIAALLFSARALVLSGRLAADGAIDYLSGLLIGDELRAAPPQAVPILVGEAALCSRYRRAMQVCGMTATLGPDNAVAAGLLAIARKAELVDTNGDNR